MITINLEKARTIAHAHRRAHRAHHFHPHDHVIAARIPGAEEAAEEARAGIRDKDVAWQEQNDAAASVDDLNSIIARMRSAEGWI